VLEAERLRHWQDLQRRAMRRVRFGQRERLPVYDGRRVRRGSRMLRKSLRDVRRHWWTLPLRQEL
jgi:hypothetical protein